MTRRKSSGGLEQRLMALGGLVVIVGAALLGLWAIGVLGNQAGGEGIENVRLLDTPAPAGRTLDVGPEAGKLAPNFEISSFDGERVVLSDFRGNAVYVNFWATWCLPCEIELPEMQELQEKFEGDLVVIAVNRSEPLDRARSYFNARELDFAVNAMDPNDTLYREYRALGMPVSFFIDPDGIVTRVFNGLIRLDTMEESVQEAIAGAPTG